MGQRSEIPTTHRAHTHTEEDAVLTKKPNQQAKELGFVERHLSHTLSIAEAVPWDKLKEAKWVKDCAFGVTDPSKFGLLALWPF
jgi:hypothetical protein